MQEFGRLRVPLFPVSNRAATRQRHRIPTGGGGLRDDFSRLLAALRSPASFDQRASLRGWPTSILVHRIADGVRGQRRRPPMQDHGDEAAVDTLHADLDQPASAEAIDWIDPQRRLAGGLTET